MSHLVVSKQQSLNNYYFAMAELAHMYGDKRLARRYCQELWMGG